MTVRLLLDTHIWIWSLENPRKLSKKVRAALGSPNSELWLSPISVWEFLLLVERGRVRLRGTTTARAWLDDSFAQAPIQEAPMTREVAVVSCTLPFVHDDPADRFIAATAAVYDLTLVTSDERLLEVKGIRRLANAV